MRLLIVCVFKQKLMPMINGNGPVTDAVEIEETQDRVHTIVIDCSSFTFIDSVGLHALPSVSMNNATLLFHRELRSVHRRQ